MIVLCPGCGRRYRFEPELVGPSGRRVRCTGCGQVFLAQAQEAAPPDLGAAASRVAPAGSPGAPSPLVLVGDEEREFRDLVRQTLESLGCRVTTTADGEEAFRFAVARRPDLMVLNVYLRKLLGVAVCEGVKGSPDLRATRVALVGSVFKSDRFVRGPGTLYGADDYFEDVVSPQELRDRLARLLAGGTRARPARREGAPAPPQHAGSGEGPPAADGVRRSGTVMAPLEPRSEIRRLARIMLSDLKVYYPEEFRMAVLERRFFETFREELIKGKELIVHRFPDLPDRVEVLAAALREGLEEERAGAGSRPAGPLA